MAEVIDNSGLSLLQTLGGMPMGAATEVPSVMSQAGGMPMIPGMPQAGGGMGLLASLLGRGQQQTGIGAGGIDPRAIRMLLFQQMNKPAQGPFSAIANPIVAALMARQIGPQIAQQQQRQQDMERMKAVLDAMRVGSGITRDQTTAALNKAKTVGVEAEAEVVSQLTPEERLQGERLKRKLEPTPYEQGRLSTAGRQATAAEIQAATGQARATTAEASRADTMARFNAKQKQEREQFEKTLGQRKTEAEATESRFVRSESGEDWRHWETMGQKEADRAQQLIQQQENRKIMLERIKAQGGSPELQKAKLNLVNVQIDQTKQAMKQAATRDPATVDTLNNLFKMAKEMSRDKAEAFLEENAAPLLAKLSGGKIKIPFNSWNVFSLGWEYDDVNAPLGSDVSGGGSSAMLPTPTPGRPGTVVAPNPAASTVIPSSATIPPPGTVLSGGSLPGAAQTDDDFLDQYYRSNPVVIPQQYLPPGR